MALDDADIHVGDVDAPPIVLETGIDLTNMTAGSVLAKKPSGALVELSGATAVTNPDTSNLTDLQYLPQAGDIDEAGDWEVQGQMTITSEGQPQHTRVGIMKVGPRLKNS